MMSVIYNDMSYDEESEESEQNNNSSKTRIRTISQTIDSGQGVTDNIKMHTLSRSVEQDVFVTGTSQNMSQLMVNGSNNNIQTSSNSGQETSGKNVSKSGQDALIKTVSKSGQEASVKTVLNNSGQEAGVNIVSNSGQGVSSVPLTSHKTSTVLDSDQGGANTVSNRESVLS